MPDLVNFDYSLVVGASLKGGQQIVWKKDKLLTKLVERMRAGGLELSDAVVSRFCDIFEREMKEVATHPSRVLAVLAYQMGRDMLAEAYADVMKVKAEFRERSRERRSKYIGKTANDNRYVPSARAQARKAARTGR